MAQMREWIDFAAQGIEALAVAFMVLFILIATVHWVWLALKKVEGAYKRYRVALGKSLLVGLELLVAADIIRTVALDLSTTNVMLLGGVVAIRTVLGWTLSVEIEGRWPWQGRNEPEAGSAGVATKETAGQ
jgi:uncharacterized membrane protein